MNEWKRSFEGHVRSFAGLQMRIEKVMNVTIAREVEHMERWLLVLATVGSAGPFIGLFGTVAGIMTSFQSIAASQNTSLAVVAPGIAEALFATAIGLVAAIPATIFYNKFAAEVNRQAQRLESFADEFSAISVAPDRRARVRAGSGEGTDMAAGVIGAALTAKRGRRRRAVMSEINVTPFVDVMLVLLIVFMVSAPLLTVGVPIDLPRSQAKALATGPRAAHGFGERRGPDFPAEQPPGAPPDDHRRQGRGGDRQDAGGRRTEKRHDALVDPLGWPRRWG